MLTLVALCLMRSNSNSAHLLNLESTEAKDVRVDRASNVRVHLLPLSHGMIYLD